jgi:hypothetical protein
MTSLSNIFWKKPWLGSHPKLGASARDIEKTSTIESAQTTLGGIKENSQSSKVLKQSLGV